MPVDGLGRRAFLCAVGAGTLAGCSGLAADEEPDRTVEAHVRYKKFYGVILEDESEEVRRASILHIQEGDMENSVHHLVEDETEYSSDDVRNDTEIGDLPMPEIYAAMDVSWTFSEFDLLLQTPDEVNGIDPPEEDGIGRPYAAPTELFDRVELGETHRLRVAERKDYYPYNSNGRVVDVVE